MDAAEASILEQGFSATSIDKIVHQAGITKGTFFYHFETKADLALALIKRFAEADRALLADNLARAEQLSRDPLQQVLIFVGLFREMMSELQDPYPGCLFASYIYEAQLFDDGTLALICDAMEIWRREFGAKLEAVMALHPPRRPVTAASLADMITVVFEGAFIMSRTMKSPEVVVEQLDHYRNYLELLFSPA
jgi:TetR/AcrR family transcriptional repressor of nem operon